VGNIKRKKWVGKAWSWFIWLGDRDGCCEWSFGFQKMWEFCD